MVRTLWSADSSTKRRPVGIERARPRPGPSGRAPSARGPVPRSPRRPLLPSRARHRPSPVLPATADGRRPASGCPGTGGSARSCARTRRPPAPPTARWLPRRGPARRATCPSPSSSSSSTRLSSASSTPSRSHSASSAAISASPMPTVGWPRGIGSFPANSTAPNSRPMVPSHSTTRGRRRRRRGRARAPPASG